MPGTRSRARFPGLATQPQMPSPPKRRRRSVNDAAQLGSHVLFLWVGPERKLMTLHTSLLPTAVKRYLDAKGVQAGYYELQDEPVEIVELYRSFLYTGELFCIGTADQEVADDGRAEAHGDAEWTRLALCYLLGLALQDERFANAVIDALIEKAEESDRYPTGLASDIYPYTIPGDHFRKLLVDMHVWKGLGTGIKEPHEDAHGPSDFLRDVLQEMVKAGVAIYEEKAMPWESEPCSYHRHVVTARC